MGFSIRNRGTKEPKPGASTEKLLDVVERRVQVAGKDSATLARERLRLLRGLVGPIADFAAYEVLDATSKAISERPEIIDPSRNYGVVVKAAPTVVRASLHAWHEMGPQSVVFDTARLQGNSTAQRAEEVLRDTRAASNNTFQKIALEGSNTGLAFPINLAGAYLYQHSGERDVHAVSGYTPGQYLDTLTGPSFRRKIQQSTMPANGIWRNSSTDISTNIYDIRAMRQGYPSHFTTDSEDFTPEMLTSLRQSRVYRNEETMEHANSGNHHRLTGGCPVANPHRGEPNLYERAAIGVLEAIGASEHEIARSMHGASIDRGLQLGVEICELVRNLYPDEVYERA